MKCFFIYFFMKMTKITRIRLARWIVMFQIGILTAMIAASIDILISLLAGWKYSVVSSCILFLLRH